MEEKINIAEILKDKPQGTKLYSLTYGDCSYQGYTGDFGIECQSQNGVQFNLDEYGRYCFEGECILFPSKEMRDWSKFAWKKGDVLICKDNTQIIFEKFEDNTYTRFKGKHYLFKLYVIEDYCKETPQMLTSSFEKDNDCEAQTFIKTIEERLGGKLNRETLEIEKAQPEFKDGDVLFVRCEKYSYIEIFNYSKENGDLYDHASLNTTTQKLDISGKFKICKDGIVEIRLATDSEKQQLFDALAKVGKAWDAEKKAVVDLKPKWTQKPFDRVITRLSDDAIWTANIFSHIDRHGKYVTIGCISGYHHCIPYNEETAKLIGTTNNWEG